MTAKEFEREYRRLYLPLTVFALRFIGDAEESRDLVNGIFESVWQKVLVGKGPSDLKSYMYMAVRNRSLSYGGTASYDLEEEEMAEVSEEEIDTSERDARLWQAIDSLPERCREVFLLSKRDSLTHAEIAEEMGISVKTVENQITKAYKALRKAYGIPDKGSTDLNKALSFILPLLLP